MKGSDTQPSNNRRDEQSLRPPRPAGLRIVEPARPLHRWWISERDAAVTSKPSSESVVERAARAIKQAGFRPVDADVGHTDATRAGFLLRSRRDGCAEIRWMGLRDVNTWPRRRASLTGYAGVLRQAGLTVRCVIDESEPYLVCFQTSQATDLLPIKEA
jgi:hypothetical protein